MEAKQNSDLGQADLPRNPRGMSKGHRVPSSHCGSRTSDSNGGRNSQTRGADDTQSCSSRNASRRGASPDRRSHRSGRSERTNRPDNNSRGDRYQPNGQRFPRDLPAQFLPRQDYRNSPPRPYDRFALGGGMCDRMSMDPRMDPRVGPMGIDPRDCLGFDRLNLHRGPQPQQGYAETIRTDHHTRSKEGDHPPRTHQDRP